MYEIELQEEARRFDRIPIEKRWLYRKPMSRHINEQWKLRGDVPGWKWRHESPSPEREDLSTLNTMNMEFTPSEVDAPEAIPPPTPPPELRYYPPGDPRLGPRTVLFASPPDALPAPSSPTDELEHLGQPPPLYQRRRQRREENPAQPLRRCDRIAARKANPPPPPSQERRPVARPLPSRPPPEQPKRGRPRKSDGSAVSRAPARPRRRATAT